MEQRRRYSRRELREVLQEVSREAEPAREEGYTLDELEEAAAGAGIEQQEVRRALQRVEQRRGWRRGLIFVALGGALLSAALILLPTRALRGWQQGSLLLHNEHRRLAYTLEVLLPRAPAAGADCARDPTRRFPAAAYCRLARVRLEPGQRTRLALPGPATACPQIWVRSTAAGSPDGSAIFALPATVEVDRKGRLDQKGVGHPQMHPPPSGELAIASDCAGLTDTAASLPSARRSTAAPLSSPRARRTTTEPGGQ